ncbi:pyridoxal phosphate-dependent transferase, partial [Zopfochytrium polystomum]
MLRAAQTALEFRKAGYEIPSSAIDRFVTLLVRPMYGDLYAPVLLSAPTSVVTIQAENRRWDVINLVSYNYLGLERLDEKFIEWLEASAYSLPSCGLSDARLVSAAMRGEASDPQGDPVDPIVSALRTEMAAFVGKEDCLVFSSGYMTNYSVFPHIVTNTTVVLLDELSHNSIWMGCRAGNPLSIVSFSHNSVADLTAKLEAVQARHACAEVLVVVEGIYSMEGTLVDLPAVAALKTTHRFTLLVDEAHSLFALGRTGRGVAEHFDLPPSVIDIHVGTFSKTPAAVGGFVAASTPLLTRVHTHAPYFSAADRSFPAVIAARVLYLLRNESPTKTVPRLARLRAATLWMRRALAAAGLVVQGAAESPILPLLVVYPWRAVAMGNLLRERGYGVVPAVPSRSNYFGAKLLVCVSAALTDAQIEGAVATIVEVGEAVGL